MSKSIYPSIPAPGNDQASMRATLDAMRQTLTMVIMNAQQPSPNYTPSSAAQVFVTKDELKASGVVGAQGPAGPQGPPGPGVPEAPNDTNSYGRHSLAWTPVLPTDGSQPMTGHLVMQLSSPQSYIGIFARDPSNNAQGWGFALGGSAANPSLQFAITNPAGQQVLWIGSDGVIHVNSPIVVGP